ncbi:elongation factor P--(R)-beta-lysine ligase [Pseudidiomarina marina]|uniref:Elongation factor P lysine(34) lysyltransferase n=1 Tax=Pseudidiomarina marina TaxID=502366 RepID=A0A432YEI8_9GAMM|nr:elongation factor P--(R)-beta-lysine ligase [Pseudidiomarina marina]PHR66180.1 MAG: elongation factor P lysine(34) lysyltransferase [Idiomarina sp.]RUO59363.1 elongation factor P lysine(34) lysyltransferase [Pseudidiomarina marina]
MQLTDNWQPSASLDVLRQRAALFQTIRNFFQQRNVLEVDTPILGRFGVTDLHLENLETTLSFFPNQRFQLQTSPEYAMKRLLAAYGQSIYQLGKVFRDDEVGRFHNPEFTMLEWYRINFTMQDLINEVVTLLRDVLGAREVHQTTYQRLFQKYLNLDPLTASIAELQNCLVNDERIADLVKRETDKDTLLQLAMSLVIEPQLKKSDITVVERFPASQAALAELDDDERVALRFEVYVGGIELANGYQELTHAAHQQLRFNHDNQLRKQFGKNMKPTDFRLLEALDAGMPNCSGVALGFDRLLMLVTGVSDIRQVLPFSITCA